VFDGSNFSPGLTGLEIRTNHSVRPAGPGESVLSCSGQNVFLAGRFVLNGPRRRILMAPFRRVFRPVSCFSGAEFNGPNLPPIVRITSPGKRYDFPRAW